MKKHWFVWLLLGFLPVFFAATVHAWGNGIVPKNSIVFITPMDGALHEFIKAEIFRKKVPLRVTTSEGEAEYILTGTMVKKEGAGKWYHYLTGTAGTADTAQASVSLFKRGEKTVLWATDVGDRSVWWGMLKKKGERKIAQRVVSKLKNVIE